MAGMWRPNLCPVTTTKKTLIGCKLVSSLSQRYEGGSFFSGARYCGFLQGNQDYCSKGNTGQKGSCDDLNQGSRGSVCIGSSYKGMNCRAKCDITSAMPFCMQKSDCSGSTAKSHCSPVYMNQPTTVLRECPKPKPKNGCDDSCNMNYGKICCSVTGGAISQDGAAHVSQSCWNYEEAKKATGNGGGIMSDTEGNLTCAFFAP